MIAFKPSKKQHEVFKSFDDKETTEILYGGAVSSGKTYLIAALIVMKCLQYKNIRVGLAREHLSTIKKNTLTSIFEVLNDWKLGAEHYKYNSQSGEFTFFNKSQIIFSELAETPSDPEYTRLGGLLLTFAVIDEAGEVSEKGKRIYQSRLGRWKNTEYGIKPMLIMTCNPSRNFLYRDFYILDKNSILPNYRRFIQALPQDNEYLSKEYIDNLTKTLTLTERRRLLNGDWEVDDDTNSLFNYSDIVAIFDRSTSYNVDKVRRISADIAFTSDKCIFIVWEGTHIIRIVQKPKDNTTTLTTLQNLSTEYGVRGDNISFDADGVGLYLKEHFPIAKEIHNGGKAIKSTGYKNLKTELYFKLSELTKSGYVKILDDTYKDEVSEELSVIKHKNRETMNSGIELISKADMKSILGHSPDIADAMAYGMIWHLKNDIMDEDDIIFIDF